MLEQACGRERCCLLRIAQFTLRKAFAYLRTVDGKQPLGRFDLDGDHCFALVQTCERKSIGKAKFGAHRKHIDVP